MIGIIIAAHKKFGTEMLRAAEGVVGPMERVEAIEFNYDDSLEDSLLELENVIKRVDAGKGVLVFSDMFGGTPTNISLRLLKKGKLEIVAGVNLPMLLKAQAVRWEMTLPELTEFMREYGARNIIVAGDFFNPKA
jgi:PTS system mannose-specific IIA component